MRSSIRLIAFGSLFVAARAVPVETDLAPRCRLLPGDVQWPTPQEWESLNRRVQGRLYASVPLAAVCREPSYNQAACSAIREAWQTPQAYFEHPTQIMNPVTQNASCSPYEATNASCALGNLASYAINVTSAEDVAAGLRFAQRHNLRVSIKNTGHDYLGKSAGRGSLGLWMHKLKSIEVLKAFQSAQYQGPAMRMGAGVQAFEAYTAAAAAGLRIIGGDCPSVGLTGGYTQGGGHGPLSSEHGLGADQVLEFDVVTAQGRRVKATPTSNADLYWALAGGGGGTYGVVLSMVVRAYPDTPVGGASLTFRRGNQTEIYWDMVEAFYSLSPALIDAGSSLATYFTTESWTLQVLTKASGDTSVAGLETLLSPFTHELKRSGLAFTIQPFTTESSFLSHADRYLGPLPYGFYNSSSVVAGRLVSRRVVEDQPQDLIAAFREITEAGYEINVLGQNVSLSLHNQIKTPNAVLPAWRESIFHVVVAAYWSYSRTRDENVAVVDALTQDVMPKLYDVTPGSGDYLSEADFQKPAGQWENDFYGVNFEKLNRIKRKYDPQAVLYANRAVGSQDWTVTAEGRLCRN